LMFGIRLMREKEDLAALAQLTVQTEEASHLLSQAVNGNGDEAESFSLRIKRINEECNAIVRIVSERLKHTFMSTFDREDVYALVMSMSAVIDRLNMFGGSLSRYQAESTPEMVSLAELIQRIVRELHQVVSSIDRPKQVQNQLRVIEAIQ